MADLTDVSAVGELLLQKVVFTSVVDREVTGNLGGKNLTWSSDELEGLDQRVLRGIKGRVDANVANNSLADHSANDKSVAGLTSVVGMVVVDTVSEGFKIVATIEELGNISSTGALNDELTARVVRGVVSGIENEIIEEQEVTLAVADNSVELILSDGGHGLNEGNVLSKVNLIEVLTSDEDGDDTEGVNPYEPGKVRSSLFLNVRSGVPEVNPGVDTNSATEESDEDHEPRNVLVNIAESHEAGSVGTGLPSAEVGKKSSYDQWEGHK